MILLTLLMLAANPGDAAAVGTADALDKPPAAPWKWVREDPAGWRIADGHLQIRAQSGTLWKAKNDARNVLLRPWPAAAGDAGVVQITVRFTPATGGEQAGAIVYGSDDDYVKIVRESLEGKKWVVFGREQAGEGKMIHRLPVDADEVTLRLVRRGREITGEYCTPHRPEEPHVLGACKLPPGEAFQVGVVAHGGPAEEPRWATFRNFRIAAP